ncbi:hypothetical protein WH95_02975 [Kiloniella litopenaei]|uniref:Uncharacterized protein n=1 Tax=Kiloniella litopenaei TaxID=1549748 RepID=A0A0M2RFG2_9PROT|nr:hypothetical protein [Kiloniella litopenaei]KKJ78288.1 hypothetical protein WH95_02975 [Kiloniella litopenaei]
MGLKRKTQNLQELLKTYGTQIPVYLSSQLANDEFKQLRKLIVDQHLKSVDTTTPEKMAAAKRGAAKLIRPHVIGRKGPQYHGFSKKILAGKYETCRIMDALYPVREEKWKAPISRRKDTELSIQDFSFLDNPVGTMEFFRKLTEIEAEALSLIINFDDDQVLDVAPFLVFGVIKQNMLPITKGGHMKPSVMKVIEAVGLRHFLEIGPFMSLKNKKDVWAFPMKQKNIPAKKSYSKLALEPTTKEKIQDQLVIKINEWLNQIGLEFSQSGRNQLNVMAGEALDNGERHSNPESETGNWTIAGFMAKRGNGSSSTAYEYVCHLSIMSVGSSIGETIESTPESAHKKIESYCDKHEKHLIKRKFNRETLRTVCALQDGVSRFDQEKEGISGGVGIMEFVSLMNDLGSSPIVKRKPQLTIVSGKSCIMFKEQYSNGVSKGPEEPRMQWFNAKNSLDYPPDEDYVFDLPYKLQGTIVTMRFTLDEGYLQEKVGENG